MFVLGLLRCDVGEGLFVCAIRGGECVCWRWFLLVLFCCCVWHAICVFSLFFLLGVIHT